ncbi:MAG: hypothetical protein ACYCYL_10475 [Acidithiobacillus sp.]
MDGILTGGDVKTEPSTAIPGADELSYAVSFGWVRAWGVSRSAIGIFNSNSLAIEIIMAF